MPNSVSRHRMKWLAQVYEHQKQRVFTAKEKVINHVYCEAALRKELGEKLEPFMERPCKGQIMLDHIDNNSRHNPLDGSNHQALCRAHNHLKNPPKHPVGKRKYTHSQPVGHLLQKRERGWQSAGEPAVIRYAEMERNRQCEPKAIRLIHKVLAHRSEFPYKDFIDTIALHCDCSQQTASRYLDKQCAKLVMDGDRVHEGLYIIGYPNGEKTVGVRGKVTWGEKEIDATMLGDLTGPS